MEETQKALGNPNEAKLRWNHLMCKVIDVPNYPVWNFHSVDLTQPWNLYAMAKRVCVDFYGTDEGIMSLDIRQ